jgi:hypothetical protein
VITLTADNPIPFLFSASSKTSGGVVPASPDKNDNYAAVLTLKYSGMKTHRQPSVTSKSTHFQIGCDARMGWERQTDSSEAVASTLQFSRSPTSYAREYEVITLSSAPVQATISLIFTGHTAGSVWFDDITLTPNPERMLLRLSSHATLHFMAG